MADRLRTSLLSYFAKYIERGDWQSCLRALYGCAETGTLLHSLPHSTLFPFLIANGQWQSVLRLSGQLMVVEDARGVSSHTSITKQLRSRGNDNNKSGSRRNRTSVSRGEEEGVLYNILLHAALASGSMTGMGGWLAAVAIVQRAARNQVKLQSSTMRELLGVLDKWQYEASHDKGSSNACKREAMQQCMSALLITRNILTADLQGRQETSTSTSTSSSSAPSVIHVPVPLHRELIGAIHVLLQLPLSDNEASLLHWGKLREQLEMSFSLSWESAVYTLLRVCVPHHALHGMPQVLRDVHASEHEHGEDTRTELQKTVDLISLRPDVAERVLSWSLQCMFNGAIIPLPPTGVGRGRDNPNSRSGSDSTAGTEGSDENRMGGIAASLAWWRRELKKYTPLSSSSSSSTSVAARTTELSKWEAVMALTVAEMEQRERRWEMVSDYHQREPQSCEIQEVDEVHALHQLCIAARLVFLQGQTVQELRDVSYMDEMECRYLEHVVRKLLLHGAATITTTIKGVDGVVLISLLAGTIQSLMTVYVRACCGWDKQHVERQKETHLVHVGKRRVSDEDNGSNSRSNNSETLDHEETCSSMLSAGRTMFWNHVLFPDTSTLLRLVRKGEAYERLLGIWQILLWRIFQNTPVLTMWFANNSIHTSTTATTTIMTGGSGQAETVRESSTMGVSHRHRHSRRRSNAQTPSFSLQREALEQLKVLVYFLGRTFSISKVHDVTYLIHSYQQKQKQELTAPLLMCDVWSQMEDRAVGLPGLSRLIVRQEDVNSIGHSLLLLCAKDGVSVTEITSIWRLYTTSISRPHVLPLLREMMRITTTTTTTTTTTKTSDISEISDAVVLKEEPWEWCRIALTALFHECTNVPINEKTHWTVILFKAVRSHTKRWRVALELVAQTGKVICEGHHDMCNNKSDSSLMCVFNALVKDATPPRWREALQLVEFYQEVVPTCKAITTATTTRTTSSPGTNTSMDIGSGMVAHTDEDLRRCVGAKPPLSESERIDLYEALAPLQQRQHWISAMELFSVYAVRQLAAQDAACFAFAVARGPLLFARSVLSTIKAGETSRSLAQAALTACVHCVNRIERQGRHKKPSKTESSQRQEERVDEGDGVDVRGTQERVFVLHEARDVARWALSVWPTPITDPADFAFIWQKIKRICSGNEDSAKMLLMCSTLYTSEQSTAEAEAFAHTVRLCHSAQDATTIVDAYHAFRSKYIGMILPEATMLLLLELCVRAVGEQKEGERSEASMTTLRTVLQDTLWMHDAAPHREKEMKAMKREMNGIGCNRWKVENTTPVVSTVDDGDFLLRVCTVLFQLYPVGGKGGEIMMMMSTTVDGIPRLRTQTEMKTAWQKQKQMLDLLRLLVHYVMRSDVRLLQNLAAFIGVLRALPLKVGNNAITSLKGSEETNTSRQHPVELLLDGVRRLESKLGFVIPAECVFWLDVLCSVVRRRVLPCVGECPIWDSSSVLHRLHGTSNTDNCRNNHTNTNVSGWDPAAFVIANDNTYRGEVHTYLDGIVTHAVDAVCRRVAKLPSLSSSNSTITVDANSNHSPNNSAVMAVRHHLIPSIVETFVFLLQSQWEIYPSLTTFLVATTLGLRYLREVPDWISANSGNDTIAAMALDAVQSLYSILSAFYVRHTVTELAAVTRTTTSTTTTVAETSDRLAAAVDGVLIRTVYEATAHTSQFVVIATALIQSRVSAAEKRRCVLENIELRGMLHIVACAVGTCWAWPPTTLREESLQALRRSCESLRRCVETGRTVLCARDVLLLLYVMDAVFRSSTVASQRVVESIRQKIHTAMGTGGEEVGVTITDETGSTLPTPTPTTNDSSNNNIKENSNGDGGASLSGVVLAFTLLHITKCSPVPDMHLLRAVISQLPLHDKLQHGLHNDSTLISGLIALQSAQLGSAASAQRALGVPLPPITRFIEHMMELTPLLTDCVTTTTRPVLSLRSEEQLVEVAVLTLLATRYCNEVRDDEKDVMALMDAVGMICPHRWDLVYRIALESSIPSCTSLAKEDEGSCDDVWLRRRLVFALQCCGPWPRGMALTLILVFVLSPAREKNIDAPYITTTTTRGRASTEKENRLTEGGKLLKVMSDLDLQQQYGGTIITTPTTTQSRQYLSMAMRPIYNMWLRHTQLFMAASVILGNVLMRLKQQALPSQEGENTEGAFACHPHDVLDVLCTCTSAVQLVVMIEVTAGLYHVNSDKQQQSRKRNKSNKNKQQEGGPKILTCVSSWLSSSMQPWNALCVEVRHLVLRDRIPFTLPVTLPIRGKNQKEEVRGVLKETYLISLARTLVGSSRAIASSPKKSLSPTTSTSTSTASGISTFPLSYPQALFTTAWVAELCKKQFSSQTLSTPTWLSRALRIAACKEERDSTPQTTQLGETLLSTPCGFSCLQYAYAIDAAVHLLDKQKEKESLVLPLLLELACSCSVQEIAELLEKYIKERSFTYVPLETLMAVWNTVLIRRVELVAHHIPDKRKDRFSGKGGTPLEEDVTLTHRVTAAFIALGFMRVSETRMTLTADEQQFIVEVFAHSVTRDIVGNDNAKGRLDVSLFRAGCESVLSITHSLLREDDFFSSEKMATLNESFHVYISSAVELLQGNITGSSSWISLWPPLPLEMLRSRCYINCMKQPQEQQRQGLVHACYVRHPIAVMWVLQQTATLISRGNTGVNNENNNNNNNNNNIPAHSFMSLFNTLRQYVLTGEARFTLSKAENIKSTERTIKTASLLSSTAASVLLPSIRGAGAGLVVDKFFSLVLQHWQSPASQRNSHSRKSVVKDRNVIRHLADLIIPRTSHDSPSSSSSSSPSTRESARITPTTTTIEGVAKEPAMSFLAGYTALSSDGLQSLLRLVVLRDGLDKRRTATVSHVIHILHLEQQREVARVVAAHAAKLPVSRVHFAQPRCAWDAKVLLLFFLRAFGAALMFVNPLGWHAERMYALDVSYTALLDFLFLFHASYGEEVNVLSRPVAKELESLFGSGVVRVIQTATRGTSGNPPKTTTTSAGYMGSTTPVVPQRDEDGVLTLRQLLQFFSGDWQKEPDPNTSVANEVLLNQKLQQILTLQRTYNNNNNNNNKHKNNKRNEGTVEVLFLKEEDTTCLVTAESPLPPPLTQVLSIVQTALWTRAVIPSHVVIHEILDAANTTEMHTTRAGLQFFVTIAPYTTVSTFMLEKVLLLLLHTLIHHQEDGWTLINTTLCQTVLDLVLRRYQYVPLNTPEAVALLCEVYAAMRTTSATAKRDANTVATHSNNNNNNNNNNNVEVVQSRRGSPHSNPLALFNHALELQEEQQESEWLLWRCAVESNNVALAPLQTALLALNVNVLRAVQEGCLLFLAQGHTRPHYDPPFMRLGKLMDTLLWRHSYSSDKEGMHMTHHNNEKKVGEKHEGFLNQLLQLVEAGTVTQPSGSTAVVTIPWRRLLHLFLPSDVPNHFVWNNTNCPNVVRFRLFTGLLSHVLSTMSGEKQRDGMRPVWEQALSAILPFLSSDHSGSYGGTSSTTNGNERRSHDNTTRGDVGVDVLHRAAASALRALHLVQPPHQWTSALHLTRYVTLHPLSPEVREATTPTGGGAELFHTLRYLLDSCEMNAIPAETLLGYLEFVIQCHIATVNDETSIKRAAQLNRVRVVVEFTQQLQRHPYLHHSHAIRMLKLLNAMDKTLTSSLQTHPCSDKTDNDSCLESERHSLLQQAKVGLVAAIIEKLYRRQSYEQLLRFAEAVQQEGQFRISGRDTLMCLHHAASIVVAPSETGGLSEVLSLLSGTCVDKTLNDILREQSAVVKEQQLRRLCELLKNGKCRDAALLTRRSLTSSSASSLLLQTPEFHHVCEELILSSRYSTVVCFYDELLHPERGMEESTLNERHASKKVHPDTVHTSNDGRENNSSNMDDPSDGMMITVLEEDVSILDTARIEALQQALKAFELTLNTPKGVGMERNGMNNNSIIIISGSSSSSSSSSSSTYRTGLWIMATLIRRGSLMSLQSHELFAATLRWIKRDIAGPNAMENKRILQILADAIRDAFCTETQSCDDIKDDMEKKKMKGKEMLTFLQTQREMAQLLLEILSSVFPDVTTQICELLLLHSSATPTASRKKEDEEEKESAEKWDSFLKCTAVYNRTLQESRQHCSSIMMSSHTKENASGTIAHWRDQFLFGRESTPTVPTDSVGGVSVSSWVSALAVYTTAGSYIGHTAITGAHATRLVQFVTASGVLSAVIAAARGVALYSLPPSYSSRYGHSPVSPPWFTAGGCWGLPLCRAIRGMKQRAIRLLTTATNTTTVSAFSIGEEGEIRGGEKNNDKKRELLSLLSDLHALNRFAADVLSQQQQKEGKQEADSVLDGWAELACYMLSSLTVAPSPDTYATTTLEDWGLLAQSIIAALPPTQRSSAVLNALMESAQDSFELLRLLQQEPSISSEMSYREACNGLWRETLNLITGDENISQHLFIEDNTGSFTNTSGTVHTGNSSTAGITRATSQTMSRMHLEILLSCASLVAPQRAAAVMQSLCQRASAVRRSKVNSNDSCVDFTTTGAPPLSVEAKALVTIACIHRAGPAWRSLYRAITGDSPLMSLRPSTLPPAVELQEQKRCLAALTAVSDWAHALRIAQVARQSGVRLQHAHYKQLLHRLEENAAQEEQREGGSSSTTTSMTAVGDAVLALHFARLQDGSTPSVHTVEQSLYVLAHVSSSPLHVLEYAQTLTLISPPSKSHPTHTSGNAPPQEKMDQISFTLSVVIIRLITEAALQLPKSVRQGRLTKEEGEEGLRIFASFIKWASEFRRIPCIEKDVMEPIVRLLCTLPEYLFQHEEKEEKVLNEDAYRPQTTGDVRVLLLDALLSHSEMDMSCVEEYSSNKLLLQLDAYHFHYGNVKTSPGSTLPTFASLIALRSNAEAALRFVRRQAFLHHVIQLSNSLLCRLFAAASCGKDLSSDSLRQMGRIAQDTKLISPSLRYVLALTVSEQSVLWKFTGVSDACESTSTGKGLGKSCHSATGKIPTSMLVRHVERVYNRVRRYFTPPEALSLHALFLTAPTATTTTTSGTHDREDGNDDVVVHHRNNALDMDADADEFGLTTLQKEEEEETGESKETDEAQHDLDALDGELSTVSWDDALKLFRVLLRNAQAHADLSYPFLSLTVLLCRNHRSGEAWSALKLAAESSSATRKNPQDGLCHGSNDKSRCIEGKGNNNNDREEEEEEEAFSRLLSTHVVVDAFLIKRLVDMVGELRKQQHHQRDVSDGDVPGGGNSERMPFMIWRVALHLLRKQQEELFHALLRDNTGRNTTLCASVTVLAVMKEIRQGQGQQEKREEERTKGERGHLWTRW